jgi:hypothetical protein
MQCVRARDSPNLGMGAKVQMHRASDELTLGQEHDITMSG